MPSPGEERGVWSARIDDEDLVAGSAKLGRWAVSEERGAGCSVVKAVLLGFFDVEVDDVTGVRSAGPRALDDGEPHPDVAREFRAHDGAPPSVGLEEFDYALHRFSLFGRFVSREQGTEMRQGS